MFTLAPTPSVNKPIVAATARHAHANNWIPSEHDGLRRIYAHSVVPGGVFNRNELVKAVQSDNLVASHYAEINLQAARVTKTKSRAVYVSYRRGNQIFWTSHRVQMAAGEAVLTDGLYEIRTRCGNRISNVARYPMSKDEPSSDVLDSYAEDLGHHSLVDDDVSPEDDPPDDSETAPDELSHKDSSTFAPRPSAVLGGNAGQQLPHGDVPEPGTIWLFGGAGLLLAWMRRRPAKRSGTLAAADTSATTHH